MAALLSSFLILALLGLLGLLLAVAIRPRMKRLWLLPVAYPLGSGIYTWLLFLLSWMGVPINFPAIALVYVVLLAALLAYLIYARRWKSSSSAVSPLALSTTDRIVLGGTIVALLVLWSWNSWLAVGRSYWAWDSAAIWAAKGYGIALEGTIFMNWGEHGLSYPLNVPLQIAVFELGGAESLPGGKLLFPIFYASVLGGILIFWLRNRVKMWLAGLGVLIIGTVPVIFEYGHLGYADLPQATYLVLGALFAIEAIHRNARSASSLAGILFGLAAWTRPEGVLHGVAALVALSIVCAYRRCERSHLTRMTVAFAVISVPWVVFYLAIGSEGSASSAAWREMLADFRSGDVDWNALRLVFGFFRRQVFDRTVWGILFPVCLILAVLNWKRLGPRANTGAFTGILLGASMAAVTFLLSFGNSFIRDDLIGLMNQLFSRTFLPTALVAGVVAILTVSSSRKDGTLTGAVDRDVPLTDTN